MNFSVNPFQRGLGGEFSKYRLVDIEKNVLNAFKNFLVEDSHNKLRDTQKLHMPHRRPQMINRV